VAIEGIKGERRVLALLSQVAEARREDTSCEIVMAAAEGPHNRRVPSLVGV
jgi:hypothetical protein